MCAEEISTLPDNNILSFKNRPSCLLGMSCTHPKHYHEKVSGTPEVQGESVMIIRSFHNWKGDDKWSCAALLTEGSPCSYRNREDHCLTKGRLHVNTDWYLWCQDIKKLHFVNVFLSLSGKSGNNKKIWSHSPPNPKEGQNLGYNPVSWTLNLTETTEIKK